MKRQLKTILILVIVIAILQIVGGIVYLSLTSAEDKSYTSVECTITDVVSHTQTSEDGESETVIIESIIVTYQNANGESVTAKLADYPSSFEVGTVLSGRYKDDPSTITLEDTDWSTPTLVLVVGVVYGIGAVVLYATRKKMGMYALDSEAADTADEAEEEEQDTYSPPQTLDSSTLGADEDNN